MGHDDYRSTNYALSLSNLIIDQQISFKAAITIKKRFSDKVNNLSDVEILNLEITDLQSYWAIERIFHNQFMYGTNSFFICAFMYYAI